MAISGTKQWNRYVLYAFYFFSFNLNPNVSLVMLISLFTWFLIVVVGFAADSSTDLATDHTKRDSSAIGSHIETGKVRLVCCFWCQISVLGSYSVVYNEIILLNCCVKDTFNLYTGTAIFIWYYVLNIKIAVYAQC